jgi:hypothetical protein
MDTAECYFTYHAGNDPHGTTMIWEFSISIITVIEDSEDFPLQPDASGAVLNEFGEMLREHQRRGQLTEDDLQVMSDVSNIRVLMPSYADADRLVGFTADNVCAQIRKYYVRHIKAHSAKATKNKPAFSIMTFQIQTRISGSAYPFRWFPSKFNDGVTPMDGQPLMGGTMPSDPKTDTAATAAVAAAVNSSPDQIDSPEAVPAAAPATADPFLPSRVDPNALSPTPQVFSSLPDRVDPIASAPSPQVFQGRYPIDVPRREEVYWFTSTTSPHGYQRVVSASPFAVPVSLQSDPNSPLVEFKMADNNTTMLFGDTNHVYTFNFLDRQGF